MIPLTQVTTAAWDYAGSNPSGAYKASAMHISTLPAIVSKLENVLGSHIVTRNVLLSSSIDSNYCSNAYTWTTSKATLMSIGQMTGTFAKNSTKYDDGEANYKLPIFNSREYKTGSRFWSRGIWGSSHSSYGVHRVNSDGGISYNLGVGDTLGVRPLIYLR